MEKSEIVKKVLAKLEDAPKKSKIDERQTLDILYDFVGRADINKTNLKVKRNISEEEHESLRLIYDKGPVNKLYTYSLGKFGFNFKDLRIDATPTRVEIKKI